MEETNKGDKSLDILGIKPISQAIDKTVEKSLEGVEGFLELVCKPALGEIGLLVHDKVRYWRLNNIIKMLEKAKGKLDFQNEKLELKSHPRVALSIIENSSLIDDDQIQEMWAGLFASSCTENGKNDENLIFSDMLKLLTSGQARIIKYLVESCRKILFPNGLVVGHEITITGEHLTEITGISNHHRIDRELDHLITLGLIEGGYSPDETKLVAKLYATHLALSLYVKCQGYNKNPDEFFHNQLILKEQLDEERRVEDERLAAEKKRAKEERKVEELKAMGVEGKVIKTERVRLTRSRTTRPRKKP